MNNKNKHNIFPLRNGPLKNQKKGDYKNSSSLQGSFNIPPPNHTGKSSGESFGIFGIYFVLFQFFFNRRAVMVLRPFDLSSSQVVFIKIVFFSIIFVLPMFLCLITIIRQKSPIFAIFAILLSTFFRYFLYLISLTSVIGFSSCFYGSHTF